MWENEPELQQIYVDWLIIILNIKNFLHADI